MPLRHPAPRRGRLTTLASVRWLRSIRATLCVCALSVPVAVQAQPRKQPPAPQTAKPDKNDKGDKQQPATGDAAGKKGDSKVKNFDFNGLDLNGRMRTPQLLYFLERANEELERASLEKRSFIPHMVRSVEEEQL
jgi:hypothetical protein